MPSPSAEGEGSGWLCSQGVPGLHAQAGLTKDRTHDRHRDVAGMHRDSHAAAVWVNVPGVAAALPPVLKPRPFKSSNDFPGSKGSKRHGEEA